MARSRGSSRSSSGSVTLLQKSPWTPVISPALDCEHPGELFEPPDLWLPTATLDEDEEEDAEAEGQTEEEEPDQNLLTQFQSQRLHREWWTALYRKEVAAEVACQRQPLSSAGGDAKWWSFTAKHLLLQQGAFLAFVVLSANDVIIKSRSKRQVDGPDAPPDFPYAFSSVLLVTCAISVLGGSTAAWCFGGWPALCRCWRLRSLLKMSPISMLFMFATVLKFMSLKYLPPDMVSMLSQMNLVMLAVAMRFVLGKRYRHSQWIALAIISLTMLQYVTVRDAHLKGGMNGSPLELSGDIVTGMTLIVLMCFTETLASVFAEKYFKERQEAFYIQKVHVDTSGLIFAALWCYVLEPFYLKDLGWSCSPQRCRQVIDEGLLSGWDRWTMLVLVSVLTKMWLAGLVARVLDSVVKQLGSCSATVLTYLEVVWLEPEKNCIDFEIGVALSLVMMSIASFAVSTRDSLTIERLEAKPRCEMDASWTRHYQKPLGA